MLAVESRFLTTVKAGSFTYIKLFLAVGLRKKNIAAEQWPDHSGGIIHVIRQTGVITEKIEKCFQDGIVV